MAIVLPGWGQELGAALGSIGNSIGEIIEPNRQFQIQIRNALATKPELLQQLADVEKIAPGTLANMGFGNLSDTINAVPQSAQSIMGQATAGAVGGALRDPDVVRDIGSLATTGQTTQARETAKNEGRLAATKADVAEASAPAAIAEAGFNKQAMEKAVEMLRNGPDVTMQKFLKGEYNNEELAAIFSSPLSQALKLQFDVASENARINISKYNRGEDLERLKLNNAFRFMMETNVSDLNSVMDFLYSADGKKRAEELSKKKPSELKPEERGLVEAYQGINRLSMEQKNKEYQNSNRDLMSQSAAFRVIKPGEGNDDQRELIANTINQTLQQRALYGGEPFSVSYEPVTKSLLGVDWAAKDRKELVFRNSAGKVVSEATVLAAQPTMAGASNDPLDRAVKMINEAPDKAAALKALREQAGEEMYKKVTERMGTKK